MLMIPLMKSQENNLLIDWDRCMGCEASTSNPSRYASNCFFQDNYSHKLLENIKNTIKLKLKLMK